MAWAHPMNFYPVVLESTAAAHLRRKIARRAAKADPLSVLPSGSAMAAALAHGIACHRLLCWRWCAAEYFKRSDAARNRQPGTTRCDAPPAATRCDPTMTPQ